MPCAVARAALSPGARTATGGAANRKGDSMRKHLVHALVLAPDYETAGCINTALAKIGNLSSDGRPILGLDAKARKPSTRD